MKRPNLKCAKVNKSKLIQFIMSISVKQLFMSLESVCHRCMWAEKLMGEIFAMLRQNIFLGSTANERDPTY